MSVLSSSSSKHSRKVLFPIDVGVVVREGEGGEVERVAVGAHEELSAFGKQSHAIINNNTIYTLSSAA